MQYKYYYNLFLFYLSIIKYYILFKRKITYIKIPTSMDIKRMLIQDISDIIKLTKFHLKIIYYENNRK